MMRLYGFIALDSDFYEVASPPLTDLVFHRFITMTAVFAKCLRKPILNAGFFGKKIALVIVVNFGFF